MPFAALAAALPAIASAAGPALARGPKVTLNSSNTSSTSVAVNPSIGVSVGSGFVSGQPAGSPSSSASSSALAGGVDPYSSGGLAGGVQSLGQAPQVSSAGLSSLFGSSSTLLLIGGAALLWFVLSKGK